MINDRTEYEKANLENIVSLEIPVRDLLMFYAGLGVSYMSDRERIYGKFNLSTADVEYKVSGINLSDELYREVAKILVNNGLVRKEKDDY